MAVNTNIIDYPDDIVSGCVEYLLGLPDVVGLVNSDADGPWIFQHTIGERMQNRAIETYGAPAVALVVQNSGTWGAPSPGQTADYPKIGFEIWADPPRDMPLEYGGLGGNVTDPSMAFRAASYLYQVLDFHMNRTARGVVMFGDVITWDSTRFGSLQFDPVTPQDDHLITGRVFYGIETASFFSPG